MAGRTIWRLVALAALVAAVTGCAALAVGGAGAAAGVYLESRGASSVVEGTPSQVAQTTEQVFADLGIRITERDYGDGDGGEIDIRGTNGDLDVDVDIEPQSANTSKVHVEAKKNAFRWDQDYARMVVERIVLAR
ncbi:MAG TPA: DUF3568 family protein [Longimicrobiales bacterium]